MKQVCEHCRNPRRSNRFNHTAGPPTYVEAYYPTFYVSTITRGGRPTPHHLFLHGRHRSIRGVSARFLNISLRLEVGVFALAKAVYIHCGYVRRAVADGEAALGVSTRL
ncbi:MAG: hypothetical protein QW544_04900 [Candidatus Caldarchaeum sp.]